MITSPSLSALRSSKRSSSLSEPGGSPRRSRSAADLSAGPTGHAGSPGSAAVKPCFHAVPPSDPLRQANRLPIKVLKMLTARTGHILHPEYLQPLPSTPVSPIEVSSPGPSVRWSPRMAAAPRPFRSGSRSHRERAPLILVRGAARGLRFRVYSAAWRFLFE